MSANQEIEIACEVVARTASAWLISDGTRQVWIPESQIVDHEETSAGVITSIFIPEWLAMERELI